MKIKLQRDAGWFEVSEEDKELEKFKWYLTGGGYVRGVVEGEWKYGGRMIIERMGISLESGQVTYKDNDRRNLKRDNLVVKSVTQIRCNNTKKGYCWHSKHKKWMAEIQIDKRRYFLGYFEKEEDAAKVVTKAKKKLIL